MLAVAVRNAADEGGDENERALAADGEDGVVEDAVLSPLSEGFFLGLGEAEVGFGAPVLLDAVELVGAEELIGSDEAERVVGVGGNGVLAALAAGQRQLRGAHALAACLIGEHAAVFIVGMGDDDHQAGPGSEALEALLESCCAAIFRQRQGDFTRLGVGHGRGRLLGDCE